MLHMSTVDPLDAQIILALDDDPWAAVLTIAQRLGVSRNTVHARLRRMEQAELFGGFSQRVSLPVLGQPLLAFVQLAISQSHGPSTTDRLADIPEVVEIHATTGDADLMVLVAAKDAADLYRIDQEILAVQGVTRSSTSVSLAQHMPRRTRALIERRASR